jgi:hypothetical protein
MLSHGLENGGNGVLRSRGLPARVQIQTKIVLVVERGLEARGYKRGLEWFHRRRIE